MNQTLAEYLRAHPFIGPFQPVPFYQSRGDFISLQWKDDRVYAVNDPSGRFALLMSMDTHAVVGVKVFGIKSLVGAGDVQPTPVLPAPR